MSSPAMSTPAMSSVIVQSCNVQPRFFTRPSMSSPAISVNPMSENINVGYTWMALNTLKHNQIITAGVKRVDFATTETKPWCYVSAYQIRCNYLHWRSPFGPWPKTTIQNGGRRYIEFYQWCNGDSLGASSGRIARIYLHTEFDANIIFGDRDNVKKQNTRWRPPSF